MSGQLRRSLLHPSSESDRGSSRLGRVRTAAACRGLTAIAAAITAGLALGAPAAGARASTHTTATTRTVSHPQHSLRYWTRAREALAIGQEISSVRSLHLSTPSSTPPAPAVVPGSTSTLPVANASALTARPGSPSLGAHAAWSGLELPWQNYGYGAANPVAAVGRVFFTENGTSMACSGTLVAPNIVLTAAHCVRDGKSGAWNSSWVFVPDVNGTSQPFGAFAARTVTLPTNWSSWPYNSEPGTGGQGYWPLDYAFLVLSPNSAGYNAGQYTGWYGMLANAPSTGSIFDLGYPTEGPWRASCTPSSCSPQFCNSPIQVHDAYQGGMSDVGISCYSSGGASGGPWFQAYNGQTYVASVMSDMGVVHTYAPNGERYGLTFFGAYFDNTALSMLNYAKTL